MKDSIKSLVNDHITISHSVIITGDISVHGRCNIFDNLRVLETCEFGKHISIQTPSQGGGNLRIEPSVNNQESSMG